MSVFVSTRQVAKDRMELILEAMEEMEVRWSKVYDGPLFLSMDAQSLGLLEPIPDTPSGSPGFRLKRSGQESQEQLAHMSFERTR